MSQFCSSLVNTVSNCATGFLRQNHEYGKVYDKLKFFCWQQYAYAILICSNPISGINSWN